jgi:alpha-1,2-mannosyltransferase
VSSSVRAEAGIASAARLGRWWTPARRRLWTNAATHSTFGLVPVLTIGYFLIDSITRNSFALDFRTAFWPAGRQVLNGVTPYVSSTSAAATHRFAFVYPAPGALFFASFAWIPRQLAGALFTALCIAAALGLLRILGVRDWRLYGLTMVWPAVVSGWQTANVSLLLAFGVAVAWRYRDRPAVAGITIGLLAAIKLFLWPLGIWLLLTRRWRAFAWAAGTGLIVNLVAWSVLGLNQFHRYTVLADVVSRVEEKYAYTPLALALHLGASQITADAITLILIVGCGAMCLWFARHGRDAEVLLGAIVLSLLATPVVWIHYFVLLLVPLAIMRPRLGWLWVLPVALWLCSVMWPTLWQLVLCLTVVAVVVAGLLRTPTKARTSGDDPCDGLSAALACSATLGPDRHPDAVRV